MAAAWQNGIGTLDPLSPSGRLLKEGYERHAARQQGRPVPLPWEAKATEPEAAPPANVTQLAKNGGSLDDAETKRLEGEMAKATDPSEISRRDQHAAH